MFLRVVKFKSSNALRFLAALAAAMVLLVLLVLRVTGTSDSLPLPKPKPPPAMTQAPPTPRLSTHAECFKARGWAGAARTNAGTLSSLRWAPFGRPERGWEVYVPLIQREIGTTCAPATAGFADAFARWQGDQRLLPTGTMAEDDFMRMKGVLQTRRAFVRLSSEGVCPRPASEARLTSGAPHEGYSGTHVMLRPGAFDAYRRMVQAAKAEDPEIAKDRRNLTIFSAYRSPDYDAARCARDQNCNGIVRAKCSPHRTGLAMDLYVGQAPGFGPDSSADANRNFMTHTRAYGWLVKNGHRFGFVNYPFEPWHWEWTGEDP